MHYQVTQGLRGCYLPDYQACYPTAIDAKAYLDSEMDAIMDLWPAKWLDHGAFVYGDHFQFIAAISECNCEDTADFNDRDAKGPSDGHWEVLSYHNGEWQTSEKLDETDNMPHDIRQLMTDMAHDLDCPSTVIMNPDIDRMGRDKAAQRAWVASVTYQTDENEVSHVDIYVTWWPNGDLD
jgi:hypothetical protein